MTNILVIDAHPDPDSARFVHALAEAYAEGARAGRHAIEVIRLADMTIPPIVGREDWEKGTPPPAIVAAQESIRRAERIVIFFPLWLGDVPALLKAFLEQVLRPGFAFSTESSGRLPRKLLGGKRARVVVTMGMPAAVYRWWFGAHSLKSLERNILRFVGIRPTVTTIIGSIETIGDARRRKWLEEMRFFGRAAG